MSYIGNQPLYQAFITDQFSGTGSATSFTMTVAPATPASILVAVSGVLQDPTTYSVNGTTLTFSSAPASGTGNISVRYLGVPASGVTSAAYRTITEFTATSGQTTFTPPSYTVGFINVYRNGVLLASTDYTATNGVTVVLSTGATTGDIVTVESFYVSSVLNAIPATTGSVGSSYIASAAVTPTKLSQPLTLGTAVSASGTSVDFTSIPSWVKRITVLFSGVSTNYTGSANIVLQLGTSGGIQTTSYTGSAGYFVGGGASGVANYTNGLNVYTTTASCAFSGVIILALLDSSTGLWVGSYSLGRGDGIAVHSGGTTKTLSGTLDRVRITTSNGTDTFDAGSINILYE